MNTIIKKITRILLLIITVLISLVLLIYILLWLPPVQQKIKDIALKEVMKITGNQISIGEMYFRPFNQLKLNKVFVADMKGDTLLYVNDLSAGFDLFKILDNHLLVKTVELDNFVANVNKDSLNSDFNFQFLIDAFSSGEKDTTSTSSMSIQINDVKITNGKLNYDILSEDMLNDSIFDFNHIHIQNFNAHLDLNSVDIEDLNTHIEDLSFLEKSGLYIQKGEVAVTSDKKKIELKNLQLQFPSSMLEIPEAWFDYTGYELAQITEGGTYFLQLGENSISTNDFKMFYPDIIHFTEQLTLSGSAEGKFPRISIPELQAQYGKHMELKLNAFINDFNQWQNTPLSVSISNFHIDSYGIEDVLNFTSNSKNQKLPVHLGSIGLTGKIEGRLPDLLLQLSAQSDRGNILLDGTGGYEFNSGNANFNILSST